MILVLLFAAAAAYGCAAANVYSHCLPTPSMMSVPLMPASFTTLAEASEQEQTTIKIFIASCKLFSKKAGTKRLARVTVCLCVLSLPLRGFARSLE